MQAETCAAATPQHTCKDLAEAAHEGLVGPGDGVSQAIGLGVAVPHVAGQAQAQPPLPLRVELRLQGHSADLAAPQQLDGEVVLWMPPAYVQPSSEEYVGWVVSRAWQGRVGETRQREDAEAVSVQPDCAAPGSACVQNLQPSSVLCVTCTCLQAADTWQGRLPSHQPDAVRDSRDGIDQERDVASSALQGLAIH